jgi:hypothetical protein
MGCVPEVLADHRTEIRNLDSDRKSLVYDNYSKLLAATSTIRRMRGNMDPLAPTTHTLGPAISHIADIATSLSSPGPGAQARPEGLGISVRVEEDTVEKADTEHKQKQRDTVRWVLDTPRRLRALIDQDRDEEADQEWKEVSEILDQWEGVAGVQALREECEEIMKEESDSD